MAYRKRLTAIGAFLIALGPGAAAQSAPTVGRSIGEPLLNPGAIRVSIVQIPGGAAIQSAAGSAFAELGTVSANVRSAAQGVAILRHPQSYIVVTEIGLRAASSNAAARLSFQAFLDSPIAGVTVRIDGVTMSLNPQTFSIGQPANLITRHRMEVEILNTMNPGTLPAELPLEFGATAQ
jgi:hypothetical protein